MEGGREVEVEVAQRVGVVPDEVPRNPPARIDPDEVPRTPASPAEGGAQIAAKPAAPAAYEEASSI